ncbi:MAG: 50S ribosomal protein L18 [Candidatus Krumholzibacteria bacterium]
MATHTKAAQRRRRHRRVRKKVSGNAECPRLCVFRSAKHVYAQLINDLDARTLGAFSSLKIGTVKADKEEGRKTAIAREVGKGIAEVAKAKGIKKVRFDRGGFLYHGRVAALADAARKNGLEF